MQAISLHPQRGQLVSKQIALLALVVLIAAFPALSLPLTMLMPLFACPLMKGKERWAAIVAVPLPAVIVLLYGYSLLYAMGLLLIAALSVAIALFISNQDSAKPTVFLIYTLALALSAGVALLGFCPEPYRTEIGLPAYLAMQIEQLVMEHPQRTQLLYQAMASGLLPVPEGYSRVTLLTLVLDPVFLNQLRLELNTRVVQLAQELIPSLYVQACIILGLFTGLRVQRLRNAYLLVKTDEPQKVRIAVTPGFSMLRIPGHWHIVLMCFILAYLFLVGTSGMFYQLAQLLYITFQTVIQLEGAAIICSTVLKRRPESRVLAGALASALYVLLPMMLFFTSCFYDVFTSRRNAEDDNEEQENDKEDEP